MPETIVGSGDIKTNMSKTCSQKNIKVQWGKQNYKQNELEYSYI